MANLLEAYAKRISISESVYSKSHTEAMPEYKKLVVAKCLDNTSKYLNESFENSVGTQRSDMGAFKKFCLNLVTVAIPDLIAFDLVLVQPMSSWSGNVAFVNYVAGTNKGATEQGDIFNNPFALGKPDVNYTSEKVVEAKAVSATGSLKWFPVVKGKVEFIVDGAAIVDDGEGKLMKAGVEAGTIDYATGAYTLTSAPSASVLVNYVYDNIVIPQNDLPILSAKMDYLPITAKARRIAIYYSQMAAYQAKQDYGFDLGDQLAAQAVGQLNYEIDTEIVKLLADNAESDTSVVFSKTLPIGVSLQDHYASFTTVLARAKKIIYNKTKRLSPTYMIVAPDALEVLGFVKTFSPVSSETVNGPYLAGTLDGLKVFVSPELEEGELVFGVNNNALNTSAAAYCPYMPVVPTQLLGQPDGGMTQGFSTLYGLTILNKDLLVKGRITA